MDPNEHLTRKWQAAIVRKCRVTLGRELTAAESTFITLRLSFIGLEAIEDRVNALAQDRMGLERYLNQETKKDITGDNP